MIGRKMGGLMLPEPSPLGTWAGLIGRYAMCMHQPNQTKRDWVTQCGIGLPDLANQIQPMIPPDSCRPIILATEKPNEKYVSIFISVQLPDSVFEQ